MFLTMLDGVHLEAYKIAWFVCGCAGLLVSFIVLGEVSGDLRFVLRDVRTVSEEMWDARRVVARQTFGTMLMFLLVQVTIFIIRLWALLGPRPFDPSFRSFWATDGSIMMVMNVTVAVYQLWYIKSRHEFIHIMDRLAARNKSVQAAKDSLAAASPPPPPAPAIFPKQ